MAKRSLLVISAYPPKGSLYGHTMTGAASYTKNTLLQLKKHLKGKIVVLAEAERQREAYSEDGIEVRRFWKRGNTYLYWEILREVHNEKDIKDVLFAFEWSMFSDKRWHLAFVPVMIAAMRLMGKRVFFVSHAVLLDADSVAGQVGTKKGSTKTKLLSLTLKSYYWLTVFASNYMVLFEEGLRQELIALTGKKDKLVTIPHGVDEVEDIMPRQKARKKLGFKEDGLVLMYFGFLIWYKGADWLVDTMSRYLEKNPDQKIRLLIAGGKNPRFKEDSQYQKMIDGIHTKVRKHSDKITITGFVPESDFSLYFAASDVLVMPYRAFVSSSGPLSWAFSYGKPVVLSDELRGYFVTEDMKEGLQASGLTADNMTFPLTDEGFENLITRLNDKRLIRKLANYSEIIRNKRSWKRAGEKYVQLIGGKNA